MASVDSWRELRDRFTRIFTEKGFDFTRSVAWAIIVAAGLLVSSGSALSMVRAG
jgi:hypothetical protein